MTLFVSVAQLSRRWIIKTKGQFEVNHLNVSGISCYCKNTIRSVHCYTASLSFIHFYFLVSSLRATSKKFDIYLLFSLLSLAEKKKTLFFTFSFRCDFYGRVRHRGPIVLRMR